MNFDVYEYSDKGGRNYNEDSVGSRYEDSKGIFVVADGLGGHNFGELASECAVSSILSVWDNFSDEIEKQFTDIITSANSKILDLQREKNTTIKSTVALLMTNGRKAIFANIGDSRVYYFHNNALKMFTEDHSVAYKKYKAGEITRDMIGSDEDQSRLLRTLGSQDRYQPNIYTVPEPLEKGDAFMLCSDGVWEYLYDEEILVDLLKSENAQQWAELMLVRIMDRTDGENDNLSMITVITED